MAERIVEVTLDSGGKNRQYTWVEDELKISLLKMNVLTHYGNGKLACTQCGFDDMRALTIDHISGGGGKHRKEIGGGGYKTYRWLKRNNYPEGYQTLCFNCNWVKLLRTLGHPKIKIKEML